MAANAMAAMEIWLGVMAVRASAWPRVCAQRALR
jgi:hypothetical protein